MIFPFSAPTYALFCAGALALILSPGPDFFYVFTRGVAGGRGAGLLSALGIGAGLLVHTALAASGLTLLLLASSALFDAVKWLGAAYLIWIGVKLLRAGGDYLGGATQKHDFKPLQVFQQGVLTNVFNPKVALTFAAFVLPFVHPETGSASLQIAILGATLCVLATSWFCVIGIFAGRIGAFARNRPRAGLVITRVSGAVLVLLGARLGFATR